MAATHVAGAARRHRLGEWLGTNRLPGELHVRHWQPDDEVGPRLQSRRMRRLPAGLGTTSGTWSLDEDPDTLVRIDVCEQPSRDDAQRAVPAVLAQMQSPLVRRLPDATIGDVLFTLTGGRVVVFTRANLVVVVASVGRRAVDIGAVAAAIDRSVTRMGASREVPSGADSPLQLRLRRGGGRAQLIDVQMGGTLRTAGPPMVRVLAPPGRLVERAEGLVYEPADPAAGGVVKVLALPSDRSTPQLMARARP